MKCAKSPESLLRRKEYSALRERWLLVAGAKAARPLFYFFVASVVVAGQKSHRFLAALFRLIPGGQFESQT